MMSDLFALIIAVLGLTMGAAFVYMVFINVITFFNLLPARGRGMKYGFSVVLTIAVLFIIGAGLAGTSLLVFMGGCAGLIIAWGKLLQSRDRKDETGLSAIFTLLSFVFAGGLLGALTSFIFSISLAFFLSALLGPEVF
jgi:hypothetical protein